MGGRTAQRSSHGGEGAEPRVGLASQRGPDVFCIKLAYLFPGLHAGRVFEHSPVFFFTLANDSTTTSVVSISCESKTSH